MEASIIESILTKQNPNGSWGQPERFYLDKYKGSVWNLLILAELNADPNDPRIKKACEFILSNSYEKESGGFSTNYSIQFKCGLPSKVAPCLTGNMVFSLIKLGYLDDERVQKGIDWIVKYQRADDGEFKSDSPDKYQNLKACFSKHSCFMGVVKSLKALAEIPTSKRSEEVKQKIDELTEFMLIHHIYKKSQNLTEIAKPSWKRFGFPLMYQTDILEILDIFRKLEIRDPRLNDALTVVRSKSVNGEWVLENTVNGKTIESICKKNEPCKYLTDRAKRVLSFYDKTN